MFSLSAHCYKSETFGFDFKVESSECTIDMQVFSSHISTSSLPRTKELLQLHCPLVLQSECFNELNLPFFEEVNATEIGHLFEHILLAYLYEERVSQGVADAVYEGETTWNWSAFPYGSFTITVTLDDASETLLHEALKKTITVVEMILASGEQVIINKTNKADRIPLPALS